MWVKLHDGWDENPKILSVSEPAILMWIRAITYANRNKTGGYIPRGALHKLTPSPAFAELADELANVRVPGCTGGLFDRLENGYRVHDYEVYQPAQDTEGSRSQGPSGELREKRSRAGKAGAESRWHPKANDSNVPPGNDGKVPMAKTAGPDGKPMAPDSNPAPADGPTGFSPARAGRETVATDGKVPMPPVATFATPDPVPAPVHTHAITPARGTSPGEAGLATADVWLAAVRRVPALTLLHDDQAWARDVEGTSALRATRAEDAEAAILAFADKTAGRTWHERGELVRELGGYVARAKQIGDERRSRERGRSGPSPARTNGHHGPRQAPRGAPVPTPSRAGDVELDLGDRRQAG